MFGLFKLVYVLLNSPSSRDLFFVLHLQCKHPQTVVILLGYRDDGDLDALVGHSVLGPVLCTFLQDNARTQADDFSHSVFNLISAFSFIDAY